MNVTTKNRIDLMSDAIGLFAKEIIQTYDSEEIISHLNNIRVYVEDMTYLAKEGK